jgi:hypothetical protein
MPFTVDHEKMKGMATFDVSAPQGSPYGIPVKQIQHMDFPRVMYKHPVEPFLKTVHRNAAFEVVGVETTPAEALTMLVADEKEMKRAEKQGWVKEGYVPPPLPDPNAHVYDAQPNAEAQAS